MPGQRDIRAGRAFVTLNLDSKRFRKGLAAAFARLKSFGTMVAGLGIKAAAAGTAIAVGLGTVAVKAASDMQETMSKFNVVFGESATAVKEWSDQLAESVGRSRTEVAGMAASFQDLLVPLGFADDEALSMTKTLSALTLDLASFNNMSDADVQRDLQAALTGSGEVMKKYGVIVSEAAVKQEMLNTGLDPKNATETEKAMARLNIIMRGTTAAQGDAIRTADGFANQLKRLQGNFKDAAAAVGELLLPAVTKAVNFIGTAFDDIREHILASPLAEALSSGDLGRAAEIAALEVQLAFAKMLRFIELQTETVLVGTIGKELVEGRFVDAWTVAFNAIRAEFDEFRPFLVKSTTGWVKVILDALDPKNQTLFGDEIRAMLKETEDTADRMAEERKRNRELDQQQQRQQEKDAKKRREGDILLGNLTEAGPAGLAAAMAAVMEQSSGAAKAQTSALDSTIRSLEQQIKGLARPSMEVVPGGAGGFLPLGVSLAISEAIKAGKALPKKVEDDEKKKRLKEKTPEEQAKTFATFSAAALLSQGQSSFETEQLRTQRETRDAVLALQRSLMVAMAVP